MPPPHHHLNKWAKLALFKQHNRNGAAVCVNRAADGAHGVFIPAPACFPLLLDRIEAAKQNG